MSQPVLYLIPTPLGTADIPCLLPHEQALIVHLSDFVVEAEKTARAHLKAFGLARPIRELNLQTLNEHTAATTVPTLLAPLRAGRSIGLMSEAGCPAVADPGAQLVVLAHAEGFAVQPLVGPSSIMLALMASGANGQQFAFKGYLPADKEARATSLKSLERHVQKTHETQLFIETPYRNDALLTDAVGLLHAETRLCIAADLTLPSQLIISQPVAAWRRMAKLPELKKRPCLFVLYA